MIQKQFVLEFNKKIVFMRSYSYLFHHNIEALWHFIQQLVNAKTEAITLSHIKAIIPIYLLDIPLSSNFFF